MNIRIWCEFAKPLEVCNNNILKIMKEHHVSLNYRLGYEEISEDFYKMIEIYNEREVPVYIWPTLSDDLGYWINERNVVDFYNYIRNIVNELERRGLKINGFCIDMEPPLEDIKKIVAYKNKFKILKVYGKMLTSNLNKKRYKNALKVLTEAALYIREKGLEGHAVCIRYSYYDLKFGGELMQDALEVPAFEVPWDKYNFMYYATIIRNELKTYNRDYVDYLIYHQVSHLKEALKDKLAISVGLTNVGKLGNEPYYQSMNEFEKDIGILKECGVDDFSLFSLDGILYDKKKLEDFLIRLKRAESFKPKSCTKVLRDEALVGRMMSLGKFYYKFLGT